MTSTPIIDKLALLLGQAQTLRVARFQINLVVMRAGSMPEWQGSALRGAFGHAFKQTVCMVAHRECERCLLKSRCPYTYLFETWRPEPATWMTKYDRVPHPFILHPPPPLSRRLEKSEGWTFGMTLWGQAIELLPYLILSWEELARKGLGRERIPMQLNSVLTLSPAGEIHSRVYTMGHELQGSAENWSDPLSAFFEPQSIAEERPLKLVWETPLRLSKQIPRENPELPFSQLISSLLRRLSMLMYFHGGHQIEADFQGLTQAASGISTLNSELKWQDLVRYSSRQQKKMNMGGLSGSVIYAPESRTFVPLLHIGEILHAGKNTSFGLGKYHLAEP